MSRLLLVLTFLFGTMLSTAGAVSAQTKSDDLDIDAIGEVVLDADIDALETGLETPPDDADLPEGFLNPPTGVPENGEIIDSFTNELADLDGVEVNVSHGFDTDPDVIEGLISSGVVTYLVFEDEISDSDFDEFEEGAAGGLESTDATEASGTTGSVERIDFGSGEAVVISVVVEQEGINVVVQIIAVPVGNTLVLGSVVIADTGAVDPDNVLPFAMDLTGTGVTYLETVAEAAQ